MSIYFCPQQTRHDGAQEQIYRHDSAWIYSTPFRKTPTFSWPLVSLRTASTRPKYELGKVDFSGMFLKRKKSQRIGASSFFQVSLHTPKNPFASLGRSYTEQKKSLCNRSQFRTLFLPHRFIKIRPSPQRPVSIEFLTIPGFPKSEQNQKSCGNVRIGRKRASVRRKNHRNLFFCDLGVFIKE